ncbi:FecR family protein [Sphingobacterium faecale]|uniref:FecR domain-containing protein n=1 Tax=Sphingobacterium faecale TaxID=2803775 RepID=A0ABS1QYK4_9SPHI|nr:FecR family protein [Sphingobacterium faecale]MBL1407507.1 FecR domain-containing protein [Sphingobacterium faecale]
MEHLEHIKSLYSQYLAKTISEDDQKELIAFFKTGSDAELDHVIGELDQHEQISASTLRPYDQRAGHILSHIRQRTVPVGSRTRSIRVYITVAAVILAFAFIGYYFYKIYNSVTDQEPHMSSIYGDDVAPGSNIATITLSDGSVIDLSEDQEGIIASGSALRYADGEKLFDAGKDISYATLKTPRGGQYRLTLPDGSKVILNAASSITYPTAFTDIQRKVELQGEAFFDVAENKRQPFIVATDQQQVIVTGTTFNVNAYSDNNRTVTTLVTGSVLVQSNSTSATATLRPGQEAVWSNGKLETEEVNTSIATGWTEGVFAFQYTSLAEILPQLERWYDIQIDIHPIPNEEFYAEIDRNKPLSTVLKAIEKTSTVRFEIKERRLTLKKK